MAITRLQMPLPLFEFPSKIVLIDDNLDYIKALQVLSSATGFELIPFNNPRKALDYLQKRSYCKFIKESLPTERGAEIFHSQIDVHLNNLHQEIYNPARFDEISLLVIDYAMPGMNGQEFCKQISNLPIKKLLLTGEASFEKAVEMFNAEIIDKFVKKDEDFDAIFKLISDLQYRFFQKVSEPILTLLRNSKETGAFFDEKFIEFFQKIIEKNNIIEYYAADNCGSYLLVDKSGSAKLLIVKPEEDMQVLYEIAEGDSDVTSEILEVLKKKEKIAFFQTEQDMASPATLWYLHDAERINGSLQKYYYALIPIGNDFKLNQSKITSYQKYINSEVG